MYSFQWTTLEIFPLSTELEWDSEERAALPKILFSFFLYCLECSSLCYLLINFRPVGVIPGVLHLHPDRGGQHHAILWQQMSSVREGCHLFTLVLGITLVCIMWPGGNSYYWYSDCSSLVRGELWMLRLSNNFWQLLQYLRKTGTDRRKLLI